MKVHVTKVVNTIEVPDSHILWCVDAYTAGMNAACSCGAAPGWKRLTANGKEKQAVKIVAESLGVESGDVTIALSNARHDAELVDVGKRGGGVQVPQETTEQLLVRNALAGRSVAQVKSDDLAKRMGLK